MEFWRLCRRWFISHISHITKKTLLIALTSYLVISWLLLIIAQEEQLTHSTSQFIYYILVTASTVGYGDLSPSTPLGQWVVALFVIPVGLSLFGVIIGQLASAAIQYWRSGILGTREVNVKDHILILGWNEQRTLHLINMLQHEVKEHRAIVLCVRPEMENPLPGKIEFVRVNSFTDPQVAELTSMKTANCIIIDNPEDDITLSAALYSSHLNPKAHLLAYFHDESLAKLLKQHCPNAECIPSVAVEMLAKAAIDPGSSELHHELLTSHKGMTQYSVIYQGENREIASLFQKFKEQNDATLIAIEQQGEIIINPDLTTKISQGDKIFYIADERIDNFHWH
ncbi:ion channel [Vibrio sp. SS-MA-C1-2]|uniref:ion channel n=1 Tax=Vibrio sp. SS-MA-C1-2 TaxID=2908646 RepID=UPI001F492053|nr:ion channel [Vibrio sp. SS-MA-C1-2]UJF16937.1 ion channel [Vibrio sp. SS-MA-C1-2]